MAKFKTGDIVRLTAKTLASLSREEQAMERTAMVRSYMGEAYAGGIMLETTLNGNRFWNEADLVLVRKKPD